MTAERWKRIEEIYQAALDNPAATREAFIAEACQGDDILLREIHDLVGRHESDKGYLLDHPTGHLAENDMWQMDSAETIAGRSASSLVTGARLGPYEIGDQIGEGGMGKVFRARDTRLDRTVAIKVSVAHFSGRFAREARVIASLNHSNICTLFDVAGLPRHGTD